MPVRGLVTAVSSTSLHVQTATGSVTVGLAASTTVTRRVAGSTADLSRGQQIDAQLTSPGGTVIKSIHIELPPPRTNSSKRAVGHLSRNRTRLVHLFSASGTSKNSGPSTGVSGQIVSLGSSTITIRSPHGNTASYQLASNLSVSKTMLGRAGDLAFGETVFAWVNRTSGVASTVTILSS